MAKLKGDFSQIKVINGPLLPIAFIPNSSAMQLKTILQRRMYLCAICQSKKKGLPDVVANLCSYKISNIKFERRKMFLFQLSNFMCFFRFRFREIYWYPFKEDCTFVSFPNSDFDSIPCHFEPFYRFPVSTQDLQKPIGFQLHHRIRQKYQKISKGEKRMAFSLQESLNPLSLVSHLCH